MHKIQFSQKYLKGYPFNITSTKFSATVIQHKYVRLGPFPTEYYFYVIAAYRQAITLNTCTIHFSVTPNGVWPSLAYL